MTVAKFINYGERILLQIGDAGWWPGARYTNLRTVKRFNRIGFLDIDWKNYCFDTHLAAAKKTKPVITVARDVMNLSMIGQVREETVELKKHANFVIVVPKDPGTKEDFWDHFPFEVLQGYSVPTKYGGTTVESSVFNGPVHLLGGNPLVQRKLARQLNVVSLDNNRITVDAQFGKFFDGKKSVRHPKTGKFFDTCIHASISAINDIWGDYSPKTKRTSSAIKRACRRITSIDLAAN